MWQSVAIMLHSVTHYILLKMLIKILIRVMLSIFINSEDTTVRHIVLADDEFKARILINKYYAKKKLNGEAIRIREINTDDDKVIDLKDLNR